MCIPESNFKFVEVTGSNKGIGFGIVKGLCEKYDGVVYLTARDVGRGEKAVQELNQLGFKPVFHQLDITDQQSVNRFRDHIKDAHGGLDLLVNNAAIVFKVAATEPFGVQAEKTVKVNYFGTLMVCKALFPLLRYNAKVVNISSSCGHLSHIPSDEIVTKLASPTLTIPELNKLMEQFIEDAKEKKRELWGNSSYVVSKVGITALTFIQQRLFDEEQPNRNIAVNAVHPGYVATDMSSYKGDWTIEQGTRAPLFCALEADFKGKYVWKDTKVVDWCGSYPG